jgi:mitogen-activated protein kinase kinase kinase
LKSGNVLLEPNGTCKLSGFGAPGRPLSGGTDQESATTQNSVFWMAPEVVRPEGRGYTSSADIWSLGCIVLEMWSGRRPWTGASGFVALMEVSAAVSNPALTSLTSLSSSLKPSQRLRYLLTCNLRR